MAYLRKQDIEQDMSRIVIFVVIIQQIVTLSKYGHDSLNICHP